MTTFTSDWVTQFVPTWTEHVVPALAGREDVRWLEVGSYEGRSALWTLDNVLTGRGSTITCVDRWDRLWTRKGELELRFDDNVRGRANLVKLQGPSSAILPTLPKEHFHGAYVDGSHEEADVYQDAWQVYPLLRPDAFLIFDDYESSPAMRCVNGVMTQTPRQCGVYAAVNRFLGELGRRPLGERKVAVTTLHVGWQLILRLG